MIQSNVSSHSSFYSNLSYTHTFSELLFFSALYQLSKNIYCIPQYAIYKSLQIFAEHKHTSFQRGLFLFRISDPAILTVTLFKTKSNNIFKKNYGKSVYFFHFPSTEKWNYFGSKFPKQIHFEAET